MQQYDPAVHVGNEDYLFLAGGAHSVFSYFLGDTCPSEQSIKNFWSNVEKRSAFCDIEGRFFRHLVFPEKCVCLSSLLSNVSDVQSLYTKMYKPLAPSFSCEAKTIFPLDCLLEDRACFYKTDTHYSHYGNLQVVKEIVSSIFPNIVDDGCSEILRNFIDRDCYVGDLGMKAVPPKSENTKVFSWQKMGINIVSNGVAFGNDGIISLCNYPKSLTSHTALVFGDSFFRGLLPFLSVFFRNIFFLRSRFFHFEAVRAVNADFVFSGQTERYLSHCPLDSERSHFLSIPYGSGRQINPDHGFHDLWNSLVDARTLARYTLNM